MLEKFRQAKQPEIERLKKMNDKNKMRSFYVGTRPSFSHALTASEDCAVIAEYKRASPSMGDINLKMKPKKVAEMYKRAGAACVSVLTEEDYFKGSLDFLDKIKPVGLPMLRKDFIFDPLQVQDTASTPASAILLIARYFPVWEELARMVALSVAAGLEPVVEVFDLKDLDIARKAGASIIQVNNRDLDTLKTSLDKSLKMGGLKKDGEVWIAASGIFTRQEVLDMKAAGFDAVLIGTSLMREDDPEAALAKLTGMAS